MTLGVGNMRRGIAIARDFASRRSAFGGKLSENPLHLQTLADMETEFRGALQLWGYVLLLLGKNECGKSTKEEEVLLRLLTPLAKLYIAKQSISVTSEAIESLGGTGYMEDSDLPDYLEIVKLVAFGKEPQIFFLLMHLGQYLKKMLWKSLLKKFKLELIN